MKQKADTSIIDLFKAENRGRPYTGLAKSNAQRMKEYRQRLKSKGVYVAMVCPDDVARSHDSLLACSREILQLRKELDAALKLVEEYRNALHKMGEI